MEGIQRNTFQLVKIHVNIKARIIMHGGDILVSQSDQTRTTVSIHNRKYTIVGKEPAHHVRMVASLVDQKMKEIQEANPRLDTSQLAVLTAVNTMNDFLKLEETHSHLQQLLEKDEDRQNDD